ncbi:Kelch motif-containing protein [Maribacter dokdonensis]|uniref:Kelch motif-containing protein n=1 Tax=Maribacter dokdonensis TaxID=320912 RepID=A0ABY0UCX0_9FLAO|nr:carboxypeptidase-like regulatory domain-containing protein [Maribacter dokdonensis]SDS46657.1 Kelch motif-containing protein [Maribacter dokdonensis]
MKLSLVLFFTFFTVIGQNIEGTILDAETNQPIEFVNIYVKEGQIGTTSDGLGKFNLVLNSELNSTQIVFFTILGYHPKSYSVLELEERNYVVYLQKKTENLNEVTLSGNRKRKPSIAFTKLASLPVGVHNFGSTIVNGKMYIHGGDKTFFRHEIRIALENSLTAEEFMRKIQNNQNWKNHSDALQIYDIENDSWDISDLKFRKRAYHRITTVKDQLYIIGGKRLSTNRMYEYLDDKIEVLSLSDNTIQIDDINPHQALNFAAFSIEDNIIVMGGSTKRKLDGPKTYSKLSRFYNTKTGYWYDLPNMTTAKEINGVTIGNKIYLIGGYKEKPLKEIESFNLESGQWQIENELPFGIANPAITSYKNTIYIFDYGKIYIFNTLSKRLTEYNIDLNIHEAQMHYYENKLYIVGGRYEERYKSQPLNGLYSIHLNEFENTKVIQSLSK